eukprot:1146160-Pelagomonas_calceolata.AAC.2
MGAWAPRFAFVTAIIDFSTSAVFAKNFILPLQMHADMNLDCAGVELMNRLEATYQSVLFGFVGSVNELQRLWLETE